MQDILSLTPLQSIPVVLGVAFLICYHLIPVIVSIALMKKLYDEPNHRSAHTKIVPSLGGLAIFFSFMITTLIFNGSFVDNSLNYVLAGILVVVGLGIKDDILILDPKKKFWGQIMAAFLVCCLGNIRLTSFQGLLGIYDIPYWISVPLSMFFIVAINNALNLVDGIDGLAAGVTTLAAVTFGTWFFYIGDTTGGLFATAMVGSVQAFMFFNVFGKKNKIFLGDTGSLFLGLLVAVLAIRFVESNLLVEPMKQMAAAPAVAFGAIMLPVFDTLRVMLIRKKNGKPLFEADRNHLHHRMLELGYDHKGATFRLLVGCFFMILVNIILQDMEVHLLFAVDFILAGLLTSIPDFLLRYFPKHQPRMIVRPIWHRVRNTFRRA